MASRETHFDRLLAHVDALRAAEAGGSPAGLPQSAAASAEWLAAKGEQDLAAARDAGEIESAACALAAAARLMPASFALSSFDTVPAASVALRRGLSLLARQLLVSALDCLGASAALADAALEERQLVQAIALPGSGTAQLLENIAALDNIAAHHREHERYYTVHVLENAANLARETNKLRVLVDVWRDESKTSASAIPTGPGFGVAGCEDLNALPSIAAIGILFMEGQGEPAEIRALKGRLAGLAAGTAQSGQWLADAMAQAWTREAPLLSERYAAAAFARYRIIATNWVNAQETVLIGRLAALASARLEQIAFTPQALRTQKRESAERLETVARIMEIATRLQARSAADLSTNDRHWTQYRARLAQFGRS